MSIKTIKFEYAIIAVRKEEAEKAVNVCGILVEEARGSAHVRFFADQADLDALDEANIFYWKASKERHYGWLTKQL